MSADLSCLLGRWSDEIETQPVVYLNGRRCLLSPTDCHLTLLEFLREKGLCGTKLGCGEGGCGACTVMVSSYDASTKSVKHRPVNSCLAPLLSVEGQAVVTVEGLGTRQYNSPRHSVNGNACKENGKDGNKTRTRKLHPIQAAMVRTHASQCGFCTPGFVMSAYVAYRQLQECDRDAIDWEEAISGNLCRCTGYRPILAALESLTSDRAMGGGQQCCQGEENGSACPCRESVSSLDERDCDNGGSSYARNSSDPIYPPELRSRSHKLLVQESERLQWIRPATLQQLLAIKAVCGDTARLVCGSTEITLEIRQKHRWPKTLVSISAIPELTIIQSSEGSEYGMEGRRGIVIGGAATLGSIEKYFKDILNKESHEHRVLVAFLAQLRWFAGPQIRSVACLGGNIVTGSPISDLNPLLIASSSIFKLVSEKRKNKPRYVRARDFFIDYRKVDLDADEILQAIFVPFTESGEFIASFKQSHRREDDIALVNAGLCISLENIEEFRWRVSKACFAFGGVSKTTLSAAKTEDSIVGFEWDGRPDALFEKLRLQLLEEIHIPMSAPGGMAEFRMSLVSSFVFKFIVAISNLILPDAVSATVLSASSGVLDLERYPEKPDLSNGVACHDESDAPQAVDHGRSPVGQPFPHKAAELHVTGEAEYTDDLCHTRMPRDLLHAALVLSRKPHARIIHVDLSTAEQVPGYVNYFGYQDVPGTNFIGPIVHDEECFAEKKVTCVGQVIGIVVAESELAARDAANKVQVEYEDLPAILTIEEAVRENSFLGEDHRIVRGDVDAVFGRVDLGEEEETDMRIVQGEMRIGAQEHFYLEPHVTVCVPHEGEEMTILSSTQAPMKTQTLAAAVLGVPFNKVVAKTKRIGGGFGGKETRNVFIACACSVAAFHSKQPVRLALSREEDMAISGQRHPFLGKYKVAFNVSTERIEAVKLQLYSNAGNTADLSQPIIDRALFHSDNVYNIPHFHTEGRACKTNLPSNTAFRGFGGPQGMMIAETWIEHVAAACRKPAETIRRINMYNEGDRAHFGQKLENCHIRKIWSQVEEASHFDQRRRAVEQYNACNKYRKRGLALVPTKFGISFTAKFMNQAGALVNVYTDGTVLVTHGGIEMGQGLHTKMCQVAAEALGVSVDRVHVAETSTDKVPNASPTAASASSDLYGMAVLDACQQIRKRMDPFLLEAAKALGASSSPDEAFKKAALSAYLARVDLSAHGWYATPNIGYDFQSGEGDPFNYFCYGACACEVETDILTGDVQVLSAHIVHDVGNSLNPPIDIGQIEGGFVQGLGWCLLEEMKWGDKHHAYLPQGVCATTGPGAYKIPTANDVPKIFSVNLLKDCPNPRAIHSSKAVGEPPFFLAAAAFFAVRDSIRYARGEFKPDELEARSFFDLFSPATPERVRLAVFDNIVQSITGDVSVTPGLSC